MYIKQKNLILKYTEKHIKINVKKINKQSNRKMVKGHKQMEKSQMEKIQMPNNLRNIPNILPNYGNVI